MIQVQFDENVVLDVLLDRQPWSNAAALLLSLCDQRTIEGCWCAAPVGTVYYLIAHELGRKTAQRALRGLNRILQVTPVDSTVISDVLADNWPDLEDAIVHASARQFGATHVVTQDPKDAKATLIVCDAASLLGSLA
jgi:hypothetical protein